MSKCRHYRETAADMRYHVPLGPDGIDCCLNCYVAINPPNDMAVFTMLNDTLYEQWQKDYHEANWLIAEKDAEIDGLREQIEILEAQELA